MRTEVAAPTTATATSRVRAAVVLLSGAAVLALAVRLPFGYAGLSMDEGGYAYVARRWARGTTLYRDAWLDRPQGLLLAYRGLLAVADAAWTVRVGAALCGALLTVALGIAGWLLAGRRVGVIAAATYAIVGVAPHLEGFTLNGELLASVPATAAVAAALGWWRTRRPGWLLAAGLAAGAAVTMKQSGVDGGIACLAVLLVADSSWRQRIRHAGLVAAGALVPVGASVLHGGSVGLRAYWHALGGYQLAAAGGIDRGHMFLASLPRVGLDLAVLVAVAAVGGYALRRRRAALVVAVAWLGGATLGAALGGSWWPHYYVQLVPPLVLLVAVGVAHPPLRRGVLFGAVAVLPTVVWLLALVPMTPTHRHHVVPYYRRAVVDQHVAAAVRAETQPHQQIYVLASEANVYFLADRDTTYPYLWGMPMRKIPDALPRLRALLDRPGRPVLVLLYAAPDDVDPSGRLGDVLAAHYRPERTVDGIPFLRAST
ncbi:MAG TPA: glycosyltransferase family 39 protein [Actinocatenispora sp.]